MSVQDLLAWLTKNWDSLARVGSIAVVLAGALWTIYTFRVSRKDKRLEREDKEKEQAEKKPATPSIDMNVAGNAQASGPGATYNAPITFNNPDPASVVAPVQEEIRRLSAQQEALAAQIARDKGVSLPTLRAILERMGETGVADQDVERILGAKADELVTLRGEAEAFREAFPDLGAVAQEAQKLIDAGALDAAHKALAKGREAARRRRQDAARAEADLLALDARVDDLKLAYRAAAAKYGEAASLVAGFDTEARFAFLRQQQDELYRQGLEFGDNPSLVEAISVAREALAAAQNADQRGAAMNNLGNALSALGERENGTKRLEMAVETYRAALQECTFERVPLDWARTQSNLGNAFLALSRREPKREHITNAIDAYRHALNMMVLKSETFLRATTQSNLGSALTALAAELVKFGEFQKGILKLRQAIEALREALLIDMRQHEPFFWGAAQANLGNALLALGNVTKNKANFRKAVTAYDQALLEQRRERVPLQWAKTFGARGVALLRLAEMKSDISKVRTAEQQITDAEQTLRNGGDIHSANYYAPELIRAQELIERLTPN